jgi:hypothetical protein
MNFGFHQRALTSGLGWRAERNRKGEEGACTTTEKPQNTSYIGLWGLKGFRKYPVRGTHATKEEHGLSSCNYLITFSAPCSRSSRVIGDAN